MQQDQYKFVLCTYNTRDTQPRDILPLDDFNVDYLNDEEGERERECECVSVCVLCVHIPIPIEPFTGGYRDTT